MHLLNGVDPWGRIHAICPSANLLGSRGILHSEDGVLFKPWKSKSWLTCDLHHPGRDRKPLMQTGSYSELSFLDEATALAAGHRPCAECRNNQYKKFKAAWFSTNESATTENPISEIDRILHLERVSLIKEKKTFMARLADLPYGAMFECDGEPYLYWRGGPLLWSAEGYEPAKRKINDSDSVRVLTPPSTVNVIRGGYIPQVHESAAMALTEPMVHS